ncbi:hypothetical protein ACKJSM_26825 [Pseudomonas sp. PHC1]|uniref:hypothetical protein n=1 Tax=Pseudomonas sp. PHC1 TaxID=3384759 RepID=UPI00396F6369
MSLNNGERSSGVLLADPPTVDGIPESDPDGNVPADVLINGGTARVKRWPNYADQPNKTDELLVYWDLDGDKKTIYQKNLDGPITELELPIALDADLFAKNGTAKLYYSVRAVKPLPGNRVDSQEKKLTIDRSIIPLPKLLRPIFPDADIWGQLHCSSNRPIWIGVFVVVPFQGFKKDDICEWVWKGFSVPTNDDRYFVESTFGQFSYTLSEVDANNRSGFELPLIPFDPHVKPLIDNCAGSVVYKIKRAGAYVGQSWVGVVKIHRRPAGQLDPCDPP